MSKTMDNSVVRDLRDPLALPGLLRRIARNIHPTLADSRADEIDHAADELERLQRLATAADTGSGEGWVLVPRQPTLRMLLAGAAWTNYQPEDDDGNAPTADQHCAKRVYGAMLSAVRPKDGGAA